MAIYLVGFDGKWQGEFDTETEAVAWAYEVAESGRVVEVVRRRFRIYKFITGFPESERDALEGRWKETFNPGVYSG
jgi:hypothetical protein